MKNIRALFALAFLPIFLFAFLAPAADSAQQSEGKIRVLVETGGHDFEKEPFFKLFKDNPDITYQAVQHPDAHALLTADAAKRWDVLVLYDMHQGITDAAKADFVARLKEGKGLVVLHHAIADYQAWPEYTTIIGAHYYLAATNINGVAKARSAWKEGMHFRIHVADPQHLRADAKKAVEELATKGVTTFCLSLDPKADEYVRDIFGQHWRVLDRIERLPEQLPMIYMALTK